MINIGNFNYSTIDVKEELVNKLNADLIDMGYVGNLAVKVIKADPQTASEIPCIGINRVSDDETSQSIEDSRLTEYDEANKILHTFYGTFFSESIEIRIWHTNADERDKLYRLTKASLFAMRAYLAEKGLLNITLRGGRDEQDSTMAQAPMVLYWSTITMSFLNPLDVELIESSSTVASIKT